MPPRDDKPRLSPRVGLISSEGWDAGLSFSVDLSTSGESPVRVGQLWVPRSFQLNVVDTGEPYNAEEPLVIELQYVVNEGGEIVLAGVLSSPLEVHEALDLLRRTESLTEWKRTALMNLAADVAVSADGRRLSDLYLAGVDRDAVSAEIGRVMRVAHKTPLSRRRNRITDEHLAEVARVYREAWAAQESPTKKVAEHFVASHSTAARWVGLARKQGLLGPAAGGRGGELND